MEMNKIENYLQKWKELNIPLHEGETVVQMVNHDPAYFLSSEGRVFSLKRWRGTEWRELRTCLKDSVNAKNHTGTNKQLCVGLLINGKVPTFRISKLMAEYFPLSTFNPANEDVLQIHHIEPWDEEKGTDNNRAENLQRVGAKAHDVITMAHNGKMTVHNTMKLKNEKLFSKKLAELSPDKPIGIAQKVDRETLEVIGTWGFYLNSESVKHLQPMEGTITLDEQYLEEQAEIKRLLDSGEATGKVRIENGTLHLVKEKKA